MRFVCICRVQMSKKRIATEWMKINHESTLNMPYLAVMDIAFSIQSTDTGVAHRFIR